MHLKQITLQGFKSFAGATNLSFEKGITCVVGPNGSGKSNVVDALAWVMGEQGTKSLRGGKMEDVIFAGTANRSPLGRAEVKLSIDNSSGILPIEYSEVTISRTLYRNGTSEYAINGEACRLLDVQELLSDSGLGREMHSIVGQGQLDGVLRANPLERRALIEEASGVLKYRRRKEKTERKLESMQTNLTRLSDLISEVKRSLRPLGRQAEVAQQAKEIAAEARELKSQIFAIQVRKLREDLELVSQDESKRKAEASLVSEQLTAAKRAIAEIESSLTSSQFDTARDRQFALENLETRVRSVSNLARQQTQMQPESTEADISSSQALESELASTQQLLDEIAGEVSERESNLQLLVESRVQAANALEEFESETSRQKTEHDRVANEHLGRVASLEQLNNQLSLEQEKRASLRDAASELDSRISRMESEVAEKSPEGSVSDEGLRAAYQRAAETEIQLRKELEDSQAKLHELERQKDSLEAKHAALGLTLDQGDGVSDALKAKIPGVLGLLADSMSIDKGYETAVAVALGPLANSLLAEDRESALANLDYLKSQELGRADFLVASGPATRGGQSAPEGAVSASSVVEGPAPVITLLSDIWIVEDINEARKLLEAAEAGSKIMITKEGDYVSQTLIAGGGKRAPSKLELAAQRAETLAKIGGLEGEIQAAARSYADQRQNLNDATEDVQKKLAALQSHDAELAAKAESLGRLMGQLEGAKQERIRLGAELEEKDAELANRESAIEALEQSLAEVPVGEFTIDSEKRSGLVAGLERSRQAETDFRVELGALVERRAGLTREAEAIRARLERAEKLRNERLAAEAAGRDRVARAQVVIAAIERLLPAIDSLLSATRIDLRELQDARTQKTNRLAELRASVTELDERHLTLGQGVQDSEMRSYELRLQLSTLGERISADLGLSSDELIQDVGHPDQENSIEDLERALRKAESRLSQLGSINPLALEEFAALEERHKYLSEQFADLSDAKKDLLSIISDLNEKMQSTFAAAFEDTKKSFERVFPILFPGGQGSLTLVGDEGQELGVEVSVKPAGKRIERMSLLSGGERSLAALALLVAIFKARPSPFYVLDEVEAALDDTNLGRLLAVLEELRDSSQLIIVTHQKRTMEIADALYGISMGKDGVTQVVGERLERVS